MQAMGSASSLSFFVRDDRLEADPTGNPLTASLKNRVIGG